MMTTPDCSDLRFDLDCQYAQSPGIGQMGQRVVRRLKCYPGRHTGQEKLSRGCVQGPAGEDEKSGEWVVCIHHNPTNQSIRCKTAIGFQTLLTPFAM